MTKPRMTRRSIKQVLQNELRPKIRLSEIEKLIRVHRIITPPLSRTTLHRMCEDGTFETAGEAPTKLGWLVYEDSFLKWVRSLDAPAPRKKGRQTNGDPDQGIRK
jgi:hypothetical protein